MYLTRDIFQFDLQANKAKTDDETSQNPGIGYIFMKSFFVLFFSNGTFFFEKYILNV